MRRHFMNLPLRARGLVFLLVLGLAGCGGQGSAPEIEFRIPVEVSDIVTDTVEALIVTTGTLRPPESVVLNVETPGQLVLGRDGDGARLVEGSDVRSGQLIAQVTGEDTRLAVRLEATRRHLDSAKREMERREQLFEERLISEEDLYRAQARYEDALHDFETSERTSEKARLITPIDGVVLSLARDVNDRPMADGQKVLQGFEVARIAPIDSLIADIDLVGPELDRVKPGQEVRISHYAFDGLSLPGTVLRLAPSMDVRTHTFRVEVGVDNPMRMLRPGMFVQAAIVSERRNEVPVVPREALAQRAGRNVIFVLDGQRAVERAVTLGLGNDRVVELTSGAEEGERVVIRGLETLTNGTRVRVIGS